MFRRKVFPHSFLRNIHCQGKCCYGKEKVNTIAVLMDLEPSGTRWEEIQKKKAAPKVKSVKNIHDRPTRIP